MKKHLIFAVAFTFAATAAGSAFACGFHKSASKESNELASMSSSEEAKPNEAMSTFDPKVLDADAVIEPKADEKPLDADSE